MFDHARRIACKIGLKSMPAGRAFQLGFRRHPQQGYTAPAMSLTPHVPNSVPPAATSPPPAPLPSAHVLSYLTNLNTPTRVRLVAARCTLLIGLLVFLLNMPLLLWAAYDLWRQYRSVRAWFGPLSWSDCYEFFDTELLTLLFLAAFSGIALALALLSLPIRRAHRPACLAAILLLLPVVLVVLGATGSVASLGLFVGLDIGAVHPAPRYEFLLLELFVPIGILLTLLLKDLCGFLRWIAAHPIAEKPPEPFLPQNAATTAST